MTDQNVPAPGIAPDSPTQPWDVPTSGTSPYETPAAPAIPQPVDARPPRAGGRGSRLRWAGAIAVVAVVIGATVAVAALLTGAVSQASVLRWVPQDSVVYGEIRMDLPGDQRQAAGAFLSHFPGFADQAALETKLDETLDQLLGNATDGKQTYTRDIKPWFGGELAFSIGDLPADALSGGSSATAAEARALLLVSVKDQAAASAWFTATLASSGATTSTETYQGTELTIVKPAGATAMTAAVAIVGGDVAVAGDVASVKAAIDTGGNQSLASDPNFEAAAESSNDDYIGFAYVNTQALARQALKASDAVGSGVPAVSDKLIALVPEWTAYRLRVESDALVGTATSPHVDRGFGATQNRVNKVVDHVPGTAIALIAGNDVGSTWVGALDLLRSEPDYKELIDTIDGATGLFGGASEAIGWIGDAGLVVNQTGTAHEGGLVIVPSDPAKATKFFTTLKSVIALGGSSMGLTVRDEAYGDATITIVGIDVGKLGGLVGGASGLEMLGEPLSGGPIELAYAVTDDVVVIGTGAEFVKHVLDTTAGTSLASDASFTSAVGRVGNDVTGLSFVDLTSGRALIESSMSGAEKTRYETDVKPFLEVFDAFAVTNRIDGDLDTMTTVITVK